MISGFGKFYPHFAIVLRFGLTKEKFIQYQWWRHKYNWNDYLEFSRDYLEFCKYFKTLKNRYSKKEIKSISKIQKN